MRFGEVDGLEVELWPEETGDEVSFGRERTLRSSRNRGKWLGAGVLAAAGIVIAAVALGPDDGPAPAPSSTTAIPTTEAPAPQPTGASTTSVTSAYEPLAGFGDDPGWDVYLSDGSGALRVFDPVTGRVAVAQNADSYGVLSDENGEVLYLPYRGRVFGDTVPLPDGTGWGLVPSDGGRGRPLSIVRLSADGRSVLETVPTQAGTALALANFVRIVGTTAADRPVIVGLDGRTYEVAADGSLARFADHLVETVVDRGRFAETTCEDAGRCVIRFHRPATELFEVPSLGWLLATSFSPDGTRVVTIEFDAANAMTVRVVDLTSGELLRTGHGTYSYRSAWLPGWSPDGRFFFYCADESLIVYDAATNTVGPVPVAAGSIVGGDLQVAGVA